MKKVRSYTSTWSVDKVLYAINDVNLPFPVTFTQMTWFIVLLFIVMTLGIINYLFCCKVTFAGKPVNICKTLADQDITYVRRSEQ